MTKLNGLEHHIIYKCLLKLAILLSNMDLSKVFEKLLHGELFYRLFKVKFDPDRNLFLSKLFQKKLKKN